MMSRIDFHSTETQLREDNWILEKENLVLREVIDSQEKKLAQKEVVEQGGGERTTRSSAKEGRSESDVMKKFEDEVKELRGLYTKLNREVIETKRVLQGRTTGKRRGDSNEGNNQKLMEA